MANIAYIDGQIVVGDKVVSNSLGPTPLIVVGDNRRIQVDPTIRVHYTIIEAPQGTAFRLFKIPKNQADGDEWYTYGDWAVYLCTNRNIAGHALRWKSLRTFGELILDIVTRKQIDDLDPNLSWTIFLRHVDNDILDDPNIVNSVHISCVWDIEKGEFLEDYNIPDGFTRPRIIHEQTFTGDLSFDETSNNLVNVGTEGHEVKRFTPLLVMFYLGDRIINLKYEHIYDNNLIAIRQLDQNPTHAWILAKWMNYPGLDDYIYHYNLRIDYDFHLKRFHNALLDRYYEKFHNMPITMYKAGLENHICARHNYDRDRFIEIGVQILYNMARNRSIRNKVVNEFMRM